MRVIPKDKVIFHFNPTNPANYTVEDGETFWVECDDCYSGQITDESVKRPDIDIGIMDCAVGPIAISGAHPGDTLCVEVMAIDLAPQGVMVTSVGLGVLGDHITEPNTKIIPVHDGFAHFSDDIKLVRVGSRVYFPVNAEGAGLAVGDMHACMGDGELSGTGIEIAGRMCLRVTVYHDRPIERPVIETADSLYFLASRRTLEESVKVGTEDAVNFLMKKFDLNFPDAYRLMSATCDAQISEVVDDNVTIRIRVPKFDNRVRTL